MLLPAQGPRNRWSAHIANYTLDGMRPGDTNSVRIREELESTAYFCFRFHAIPEVNRELSYVSERVLIRRRVVQAKNLGCRIFHEIDGGQFMRACRFRGAHQLEVRALESS